MLIPPELFNTATIEFFRANRHLPTVDKLLDLRSRTNRNKEIGTYPPNWFIDLLIKLRSHRDQQAK
ncbi:hypothetical protein [Fibrella forsythiae]|uniref:Uncharacterized protein n=1 Tax=Fibrella forsythiae TaxID=2817061 RepID=A0ABS3JLM2_9BACT|nr:hypothetical protein [Fibrella forsythiae]MBO0950899.1 hypothetical protein [Fibrella forsythiae]